MKILIAEDEFSTREGIIKLLGNWGYEPVVTVNGKEAWDALQQADAPKIALLDWLMPHMDGIDVCKKIRAHESETEVPIYIIFLTMLEEKKYIMQGFEAGADDYIAKPFDFDELRVRLNVGKRIINLQNELKIERDNLAYEASNDCLTRTFNRNFILAMLENEITRASREGTGLSIGLFDIDNFKTINDTYGHQVGDDVLFEVVHRIKSGLRAYDYLGRYGGDEFLLISPGGTAKDMENFYNRIWASVSRHKIPTRNLHVPVTISLGAAMMTAADDNVDSMIEVADKALYQAKKRGRNQVVFYPEA